MEEDGTIGLGWKREQKRQPEIIKDSRPPREEGTGFLSRSVMGKEAPKEEEKRGGVEENKGRPTFTKARKDNDDSTGFMSRSAMGT